MTAVNLACRHKRAFLIADTGSYHHDGRLVSVGSKIVALPQFKCAISYSGRIVEDIGAVIQQWAALVDDQRSFLASLPDLVQFLDREARHADLSFCGQIPATIQLFIAMHADDRHLAECYVIGNTDHTLGPSVEPFSLRAVGTMFQPRLGDDPWPGHSFEPEIDALALIERQRATPDDRGIYRVGGSAEMATVSAEGISIEMILTWPDIIGRPIRLGRPAVVQARGNFWRGPFQ